MVIHAWVQGWVAVCIAPACKASIPCKGSGRSRPGLSADGPSALLRLSRKRRVCCCSLGAPILIALGRVHCTDPVPTALACSAAAPVRCRGVARAFDRGLLVFSGKQTAPYLEAFLAAQHVYMCGTGSNRSTGVCGRFNKSQLHLQHDPDQGETTSRRGATYWCLSGGDGLFGWQGWG